MPTQLTKKVPSGPKGGRPRFEVDMRFVEKMCLAQCTEKEIAAQLGISVDTLARAIQSQCGCGFTEYFAEKRQKGFASLRGRQFKLAMAGDKTMLIWLGKQYLAQRDKIEASGPGGGPIQIRTLNDFYAKPAADS